MEGSTKYIPTKKEIKKGKDTMTDEQKEFDEIREYSAEKLKEMGVNGYLEPTLHKDGRMNINGILNGHIVEFTGNKEFALRATDYKGTIDNQELTSEEMESFFEKYEDAMVYRSEGEIIEAADVEGSKKRQMSKEDADAMASKKSQILKNIGL